MPAPLPPAPEVVLCFIDHGVKHRDDSHALGIYVFARTAPSGFVDADQKCRLKIRCPASLRDKLERRARELGVPLSDAVAVILERGLNA